MPQKGLVSDHMEPRGSLDGLNGIPHRQEFPLSLHLSSMAGFFNLNLFAHDKGDVLTIRMVMNDDPHSQVISTTMKNYVEPLRIKPDIYQLHPTHRFRFIPPHSENDSLSNTTQGDSGRARRESTCIIFFDIGMCYDEVYLSKQQLSILHTLHQSSIVWCSYGWRRRFDDLSDEPFEPRKTELSLRNGYLRESLRNGARYVRWQDDTEQTCKLVLMACFEKVTQLRKPVHNPKMNGERLREKAETWHGQVITEDEINESDIIIAVMGPTGAGKSTLIKTFTDAKDIVIGHELESCTSEISATRISIPGDGMMMNVVIIDTPGFDDTNKSDLEIFKMLTGWLERTYLQQITISAVVYLHRISDNRMAGTPLRNLTMFQKLCGKDAFNRMRLVTSMWEEVGDDEGARREEQLKKEYWRAMIDKGAGVARFKGDRESAGEIFLPLIENEVDVGPLRLQAELTQLYKELPQTDAGRGMYTKLETLLEQQKQAMSTLRHDYSRERTEEYKKVLQKELDELSKQIQTVIIDMQYMKIPLTKRFSRLLNIGALA